jgi:hypothetical protein
MCRMTKWRFSDVEQRLEQVFEGGFARLFGGRLSVRDVTSRLANAMESGARPESDGGLVAPNAYTVHLNQDDYQQMHESLIGVLKDTIIELAVRLELRLLTPPLIQVIPSGAIPPRDVWIEAAHQQENEAGGTQAMLAVKTEESTEAPSTGPRNPQLIVNGTRYVPLNRTVINIGRRADNHIVIDDPRVSRTHAQLRLRFGRYTLFDLGSTGGTRVNDHPVTEYILKSGDVIALAGVMMVYLEDETSPKASRTDTQIRRPRLDGDDPNPTLK